MQKMQKKLNSMFVYLKCTVACEANVHINQRKDEELSNHRRKGKIDCFSF